MARFGVQPGLGRFGPVHGDVYGDRSDAVAGALAVHGCGRQGFGGHGFPKAIMEHNVTQYIRAVNGDKSFFRQ